MLGGPQRLHERRSETLNEMHFASYWRKGALAFQLLVVSRLSLAVFRGLSVLGRDSLASRWVELSGPISRIGLALGHLLMFNSDAMVGDILIRLAPFSGWNGLRKHL